MELATTKHGDQVVTRSGPRDPCRPHRGLADSGLAFQQETRWRRTQPIQEGRQRAKLAIASDDATDLGHGLLLRQVIPTRYRRSSSGEPRRTSAWLRRIGRLR